MWSSYDGCFKLLDFGLTFHTEESDLHQIQSSGMILFCFNCNITTKTIFDMENLYVK